MTHLIVFIYVSVALVFAYAVSSIIPQARSYLDWLESFERKPLTDTEKRIVLTLAVTTAVIFWPAWAVAYLVDELIGGGNG